MSDYDYDYDYDYDPYVIDQIDNLDGTITNYYSDGSSDVTGTADTGDSSDGGDYTSGDAEVNADTGNVTYTYGDGSTMTVDKDGNPISSTNTRGEIVTSTDRTGKVTVTAAGKENPSLLGAASNLFNKAVDKIQNSNFLKNAFTSTDANGRVTVNPAAAGIGAIIGMLNRRTGEEGTRGLKDPVEAKSATRQQLVNPVGAATGQGQDYFTPMSYAGAAPTQQTTTTGGGIAGLNPGTARPANAPANPSAAPVTSLSGNAGMQAPASSQDINRLMSLYNQYNPQPVQAAGGGMMSLYEQDTPVDMFAQGGISTLGSYTHAAGGRMLKGPGDGMSDDIPASIAGKQPARLATDEFVIPADVVSHLGNGSSDAGAKVLYDMMAEVRRARTGRKAQGKQINPHKFMPS
jgi:hypothetical protein